MASSGSKGLERPRQVAVAGMNCATPCAPARLTAVGSNRLSCQISLAKKSVGRSFSVAAAASAPQIVSVDTGCDGAWLPSGAPISSGSAAVACSFRSTAPSSKTNNRPKTSAVPARLRMFTPDRSIDRDLCRSSQVPPLCDFLFHQRAECLRRAAHRLDTVALKSLGKLHRAYRSLECRCELLNYRLRCSGRRHGADPKDALVSGQPHLGHRRNVRHQ